MLTHKQQSSSKIIVSTIPAIPTTHANRMNIVTPRICWIVGKYTPNITPRLA